MYGVPKNSRTATVMSIRLRSARGKNFHRLRGTIEERRFGAWTRSTVHPAPAPTM